MQWPLAIEGGRLRLYATAAIPAGLYRINKPTGQLTLNFGVLSRITWLDDRGKEGLLGAELGLMGMGLIQRPGAIDYPPTIGAVARLGIRVPLGGGAAVGVHVWAAYEFRETLQLPDRPEVRRRVRHGQPPSATGAPAWPSSSARSPSETSVRIRTGPSPDLPRSAGRANTGRDSGTDGRSNESPDARPGQLSE